MQFDYLAGLLSTLATTRQGTAQGALSELTGDQTPDTLASFAAWTAQYTSGNSLPPGGNPLPPDATPGDTATEQPLPFVLPDASLDTALPALVVPPTVDSVETPVAGVPEASVRLEASGEDPVVSAVRPRIPASDDPATFGRPVTSIEAQQNALSTTGGAGSTLPLRPNETVAPSSASPDVPAASQRPTLGPVAPIVATHKDALREQNSARLDTGPVPLGRPASGPSSGSPVPQLPDEGLSLPQSLLTPWKLRTRAGGVGEQPLPQTLAVSDAPPELSGEPSPVSGAPSRNPLPPPDAAPPAGLQRVRTRRAPVETVPPDKARVAAPAPAGGDRVPVAATGAPAGRPVDAPQLVAEPSEPTLPRVDAAAPKPQPVPPLQDRAPRVDRPTEAPPLRSQDHARTLSPTRDAAESRAAGPTAVVEPAVSRGNAGETRTLTSVEPVRHRKPRPPATSPDAVARPVNGTALTPVAAPTRPPASLPATGPATTPAPAAAAAVAVAGTNGPRLTASKPTATRSAQSAPPAPAPPPERRTVEPQLQSAGQSAADLPAPTADTRSVAPVTGELTPTGARPEALPGNDVSVESAARPPAAATATRLTTAPVVAQPVPIDADDMPEQFAGHIRTGIEAGAQRLELTISPRSLGPVAVEFTQSADGLQVSVTATQSATRELLEQALPRLRELLDAADVQLSRQNTEQGSNPDSRQPQSRPANAPSEPWRSAPEAESDAKPTAEAQRADRGMIDTYV